MRFQIFATRKSDLDSYEIETKTTTLPTGTNYSYETRHVEIETLADLESIQVKHDYCLVIDFKDRTIEIYNGYRE